MTEDSLIYIVGCKGDLEHRITQEDIAKKYKGIKHFLTSAKMNKNVTQTFEYIENQLVTLKAKAGRGSNILKPIDFEDRGNGKNTRRKNHCCGGTTT